MCGQNIMIVCKFGGSSVASVEGANKIKQIVNMNDNRKIIVVSALGKTTNCQYKITDKLYEAFNKLKNGKDCATQIEEVFKRYKDLANSLGVKINWTKEKEKLINLIELKQVSKAYLVSRGEYYSALLYSKFLNGVFLDAKDYIKFNCHGEVNFKKTEVCLKKLGGKRTYVIGGFYGSDSNGVIQIFDRGGSDITGAIIAKALNCEIYENYTDVSGVYDRNPNIFEKASGLPIIGYNTAILMAMAGNEVVHKDALKILKNSNTLLLVKNTNKYDKLGTVVIENNLQTNKVYICVDKNILILKQSLQSDEVKKIKEICETSSIYKSDKNYMLLTKNNLQDEDYFRDKLDYKIFENVYVITIFSNMFICAKTLKKIKNITKKIKNYVIFANYCSYKNNFKIFVEQKNYCKIIKIINQHLQN